SDVTEMLQLHNNLRASHGASALTWSSTLASKAQQWANGCVFEHSGGSLGPFGENLASGTGSSYGVTDAFNGWASEESSYNPNNPVASHFTQVVWKGTSQMGCAVATCAPGTLFSSSFGSSKYYVCEYEAQGNVIGQFGCVLLPSVMITAC
ncbi:PR-1-like protein, partial [Schizopora paradoxa]